MSTINAIGVNSSSTLLTSDGSAGAGASSSDPVAASNSATSSAETSASNGSNSAVSAASDLRKQIETAVTQAIENLDSSSSSDDIFSAIQQAIGNTLQANGVNPSQGSSASATDPASILSAFGLSSSTPNLFSILNSDSSSTGGIAGSTPDLFSILSQSDDGSVDASNALFGSDSSSSSSSTSSGFNLDSLFAKLFANFPNGSGVDVNA